MIGVPDLRGPDAEGLARVGGKGAIEGPGLFVEGCFGDELPDEIELRDSERPSCLLKLANKPPVDDEVVGRAGAKLSFVLVLDGAFGDPVIDPGLEA